MLLSFVTFTILSFASADVWDKVGYCGGPRSVLKAVNIRGCPNLSEDGTCTLRHGDVVELRTTFEGERQEYQVSTNGVVDGDEIEIPADPGYVHSSCRNGQCTVVHHIVVEPIYPFGKNVVDYTVKDEYGNIIICYQIKAEIVP
ncbi:hypothetical protein ACOME3_001150 [Neoechinorhynchus agilis]